MMRCRRRVLQATAIAGVVGGLPSATHALIAGRDLRSVVDYGLGATRAIGTLVPPGKPGLLRGVVVHFAISTVVGEFLARSLPRRHSVIWGAVAGLFVGLFNVRMVGRRFPAIRELPLGPQLA